MATLSTGGYARPTVLADPGLVDPRLLAADYSGIVRGAGQGLQLVGAYSQQRDAQLAREDAAVNRDLRLAAEQSQLQLAPQMGQNQLALAEDALFRKQYTPVQNYEGSTINRNPEGDTIQLDTFTEIDPRSKQSSLVTRSGKPLQLAEEKASKTAAITAATEKLAQQDAINQARIAQMTAQAEVAAVNAASNKTKADAYAEGVKTRANNIITPELAFDRRNYQNLADLDKALGFGSAPAIQKFSADPLGRSVIDKINTAKETKFPVRLLPKEEEFLKSYRQKIANVVKVATDEEEALPVSQPAAAAPPATKPDVRQNGVIYRWNGTQYVPAQ